MDLVKRLKCEKKLESLVDKNYETYSDSISSIDLGEFEDEDIWQSSDRKKNHRWYKFFKSNKPDDTLWEDTVRNHRSSIDLKPTNHNSSFLGARAGIYNDENVDCNIRNPPNNDFRPSIAEENVISSERYWKNQVVPKFPADQKDLLAESLFSHIWSTQGESVALNLLKGFDSNNLDKKANEHFDNGCQWWAGNNSERAHIEFERSRRIREVQSTQKSLLHVQYAQSGKKKNKITEEITESNAELYFALGMAQSAKENLYASLKEFRRAMQISALGLGMDHELTKASLYMIRSTCLSMGQSGHEIQQTISLLTSDIEHEIVADKLYARGKKEKALVEYANLKLLYDSDSLVQARILTKIATIFEEKKDYSKAMDLWTDLLVLYSETPSLGVHHPLARRALAKVVQARKQIQPWSEFGSASF